MKKALVVPFMFMLLWCGAQTAEGVFFSTSFKPESVYNQTTNSITNGSVKFSGDAKFMKKLKQEGLKNPMEMKSGSTMATKITTGKMESDSTFSFVMEIGKMEATTPGLSMLEDARIYGRAGLNTLPKFDSIVAKNMTDEVKTMMLGMIQKMFSQVSMPSRYLKVGESFTQETPLDFAAGQVPIKMVIVTTYKLTAIKNGLAYLDIDQTCKMQAEVEGRGMQISGAGSGKSVYHIAGGYSTQFNTTMTMKGGMEVEGMKMTLNSTSGIEQITSYMPVK